MKIFVAGGTGAIGRPLIAELLAKGHALVALTRSPEKAQALVEQGIEPAIADVFDTDAVKAVVSRAQPIAYWEIPTSKGSPCVMASSMDLGLGSTPMAMLPNRCDSNSSRSSGMAKASGRGYTLRTWRLPPLQQQSKAIRGFMRMIAILLRATQAA